eukprot:TRINITY_DN2804_c0_g1_i1.p1 TRINITY_DN2804_c0_g1~~TRINITY_DN2804_c0_g1_i1.p1  ORF type:complete len:348 (+),score=102.61 TRINITY_DN2804_c0_g1_i1:85-1044(+)
MPLAEPDGQDHRPRLPPPHPKSPEAVPRRSVRPAQQGGDAQLRGLGDVPEQQQEYSKRLVTRPRRKPERIRQPSPRSPPASPSGGRGVNADVRGSRLTFPKCGDDLFSHRRRSLAPLRAPPFVPFQQQQQQQQQQQRQQERRSPRRRAPPRSSPEPVESVRRARSDRYTPSPSLLRGGSGVMARKASLSDMNLHLPILAQALADDHSQRKSRGATNNPTGLDRHYAQLKEQRQKDRDKPQRGTRLRPTSPLAAAAAAASHLPGKAGTESRMDQLKRLQQQMAKEDTVFRHYLNAQHPKQKQESRSPSPPPAGGGADQVW